MLQIRDDELGPHRVPVEVGPFHGEAPVEEAEQDVAQYHADPYLIPDAILTLFLTLS